MTNNGMLVRIPVFRSMASLSNELLRTPAGDRRPRRVPILVDNLWELTRPAVFPSRRSSAYGSPTYRLAESFGPEGGKVGQIWISTPAKVAQIRGCADASLHVDARDLNPRRLERCVSTELVSELCKRWLSSDELGALVSEFPNDFVRLVAAVQLWRDCVILRTKDFSIRDPEGECFFEAPNGYKVISREPQGGGGVEC